MTALQQINHTGVLAQLHAERATLASRLDDTNTRLEAARRTVRAAEVPTTAQRTHLNALESERAMLSGLMLQADDDVRAVERNHAAAALVVRRRDLKNTVLDTQNTLAAVQDADTRRRLAYRVALQAGLDYAGALERHNLQAQRGRTAAREVAVLDGLPIDTPLNAPAEFAARDALLSSLGLSRDALDHRPTVYLPPVPRVQPEADHAALSEEYVAALERAQ